MPPLFADATAFLDVSHVTRIDRFRVFHVEATMIGCLRKERAAKLNKFQDWSIVGTQATKAGQLFPNAFPPLLGRIAACSKIILFCIGHVFKARIELVIVAALVIVTP